MLAHHALLAVALAALGGAGWRLAGRLTVAPLERAVAAAALAGVAMVAEPLVLGRVGLGSLPAALTLAALATVALARARTPAIAGPLWWRGLTAGERRAVGAGAGVLFALALWMLDHPAVGVDGVVYHLPEALAWVHAGNTGATPHVVAEFQTGSYPLTNEVILAWGMGIGRSFVWVEVWAVLATGLLALAGWVGLRRLGCGRGVTVLAVAAVLAEPVLLEHLNTPKNDLPALAWLAVCAALCACAAPARPALLGPALAAAGLAAGSKTTTIPLAVIALVAAGWACRAALRTARVSLAWGAIAALGVGGVWYVRNLIAHGWCLYPFGSGPFGGDPEPVYLRRIHVTFLQDPAGTLRGRESLYVHAIAGGLVLVAGGILAALLVRRSRPARGASAATAVAALAWLTAPFTGRASDPSLDLSLSTTRYLLPVFAAGAVALALAGRTSRVARVALTGALIWSLWWSVQLGFPDLPPATILIIGLAGGALLATLSLGRRRPTRALAWAVGVAAVILAAGGADGWMGRTARTSATAAAPVEGAFASVPGWADSREPVAFWPSVVGPLAGDRLRHPVTLIGGGEGCAAITARARRGYVVVRRVSLRVLARLAPSHVPSCVVRWRPIGQAGDWLIYRQTATTSSARSRSSVPSAKSATPIAASRGSARRRKSVSSRS